MEAVEVDGSYGEGGGQILRTALAFSIILGRRVHVSKIRAGRERPGLRPQHAASLSILREVSGGELSGAEVGSSEVWFTPGRAAARSLKVDTGTAASVTLALQAVVPAVALSGRRLRLEAVGGTDVPWSPTFDYLASVIRAGLGALGIAFTVEAHRRGYYPRGGGEVTAAIEPSPGVGALKLVGRPKDPPVSIVSRCAGLPRHVAERQASAARQVLKHEGIEVSSSAITEEEALSPGSSVLVYSVGEGCFFGADAIGARGRPAEEVGQSAAARFASEWKTGASVDANLADMLAPLLALAETESRLRIPRPTEHLMTGLHVAGLFTGCSHSLETQGLSTLLTVVPATRGPPSGNAQHNI